MASSTRTIYQSQLNLEYQQASLVHNFNISANNSEAGEKVHRDLGCATRMQARRANILQGAQRSIQAAPRRQQESGEDLKNSTSKTGDFLRQLNRRGRRVTMLLFSA